MNETSWMLMLSCVCLTFGAASGYALRAWQSARRRSKYKSTRANRQLSNSSGTAITSD